MDVGHDPYALTLWLFIQAREAEEIAQLLREGERLDLAGKIAVAFHDPPKLDSLEYDWKKKAHLLPSAETAFARGRRLIEHLNLHGGFN